MKGTRLPISSRRDLERLVDFGRKAPEGMEALPAHDLIRMIRSGLRMTQAQLAKRAGMPQSHLAKIETGKVDVQLSTLRRIFRAMSCELVLVPKFQKSPQAVIAERIKRAGMPLRIVDKEDDRADLRFWLGKSAAERIAAVEFLRSQLYALSGLKTLPRLAHTVQVRDCR